MNRSWYAVPVGVLVGAAIALFAPGPGDMTAMLAITAFCIALWITTPVPPWLTGLVAIGLIGVVFSPSLALVGFQLPATWLIVLGILIGEAVYLTPLVLTSLAQVTNVEALAIPGIGGLVPYLVMIAVLLLRPRGLFGQEGFME